MKENEKINIHVVEGTGEDDEVNDDDDDDDAWTEIDDGKPAT